MSRMRSGDIVGVLDIGTSKIACLVFERGRNGAAGRIIGVGHHRSRGLKSGVVIDPDEVELSIRAAVAQAERMAGITLAEVTVGITCGRLASLSFLAHASLPDGSVHNADVARLFEGARAFAERNGRALVHMNRKAFHLDGAAGGDDPRGMAAAKLSADMHAVTADEGALRNVMHVVERCHLRVAGLVAAPYASALAVTTADERALGVTVVDMGGGTTSWAGFAEGQFVDCQVLATGGHHLTFEIAQNLHAPLAEAERIKSLYASMVNAKSDDVDRISYSTVAESDGGVQEISRAHLGHVVRGRVASVLDEVALRVRAAGLGGFPVVLTGGASQLVGLAAFAGPVFEAPVRQWLPQSLPGLAAGADNPAFAAAVGLGLISPDAEAHVLDGTGEPRLGYLRRVGVWLGCGF